MRTPKAAARLRNPVRRAEVAAEQIHMLTALTSEWRKVRDDAVNELLIDQQWRPVDVANLIGVTRAAMAQRWPAARQANGRPRRKGGGAD